MSPPILSRAESDAAQPSNCVRMKRSDGVVGPKTRNMLVSILDQIASEKV